VACNDVSAAPCEVFAAWPRAQLLVERLAREAPLPPFVLRTTGFLRPVLAERVADWFTHEPPAPTDAILQSYRALERETARLFALVRRDLGVRVAYVRTEGDPYADASELCAELRERRTMTLATIARDAPHPLLGGAEGGVVDQLRVVHDVLGHAALGLGFDLQAEFAIWLQCRSMFFGWGTPRRVLRARGGGDGVRDDRRHAGLRADVPPAELLAIA
jgi:hypothetical protein